MMPNHPPAALRGRHSPLPLLALVAALAPLAVAGCTVRPRPAPPVPAAPALALAPLPDDVRWVRESAEYRAAAWQAFAMARERVEELAAGRAPGTWAVSVDGDETILDNSAYEVENARAGVDYDAASWRRWVARREAAAVPGAREFLERVRELGGLVVVVTNRKEAERADTEANLRALGLPFDLVMARVDEREKEPRWQDVAAGGAGLPPAEIVLWVGDNVGDFPDLDQSLRDRPEVELAPFGDRFILVPNPMYGSWKEGS
jgi:5'-nucleotidase (lipoprotein e(P4) family)